MKRLGGVVVILLVAGLLAACGGGGGAGTPEGVAKAFLEAAARSNFDRAKSLACEDYVDTVEEDFGTEEGVTVDVSALEYKAIESDEDSATVDVKGTIKWTGEGETQEEEADLSFDMVKEDGSWKVCGWNY